MEVSRTVLLCVCVALSASLPTSPSENDAFPSDASQVIAINMLKSNIDIDGNQVHSPLGVTSILALLAEASTGETYDEFTHVFGYPKDRTKLRESFKRILGKYHNNGFSAEPSFQTWLYIYRNFNARDDYKQLLQKYYYVDVKDINREQYDLTEPNASLDVEATTLSNSKDVEGFETLKRIQDSSTPDLTDDKPKIDLTDAEIENLSTKPSKFDRVVEDKQYVEKPVILEEIQKELEHEKQKTENQLQMETDEKLVKEIITDVLTVESFEKKVAVEELKEQVQELFEAEKQHEVDLTTEQNVSADKTKREDDLNLQENETVQLDEKLSKYYNGAAEIIAPDELSSNEPEKVSLPLEKLENAIDTTAKDAAGEIMIALETHLSSVRRAFGSRSLFSKDDITSSLSANSITGREAGAKTKMLLFNGLYYRGNWATPFLEIRKSNHFFHMSDVDATEIPVMVTRGTFYTAKAAHLNAQILCLPYENKKYAMLLFVPNDIEGLHNLINKLEPADLHYLKENGQEQEMQLVLPKFQIEETSRSEAMLKQLGLQTLFSREKADLSMLSDDKDIHVDEIVQFVSVRVDEGGSSGNALSAINTQGRNSESEVTQFEVNRPFLYFIIDCEETFVLASGKVYNPEFKDELPVTLEVELEKV